MLKLFKFNRSILLFILTMNLCGKCMAQREKIYPALKENLWGLVNQKGQWIIPPEYHHNIYWPDTHSIHFLVKYIKPNQRQFDIVVYNQFGDTLKIYKNEYKLSQFKN